MLWRIEVGSRPTGGVVTPEAGTVSVEVDW
jgi:hypothetical protein